MSTPYSLADAYNVLMKRHEQDVVNGRTVETSCPNPTTIDILGIVTNISLTQASPALAPSSALRNATYLHQCQIWLTDDSLSSSASPTTTGSVRFVFYGPSRVARVQQEKIQKGDILRINNITLAGHHRIQPRGELSISFRFSNDNDPGMGWYCLGRRLGENEQFSFQTTRPTARLPESMITSQERLKELVRWYVASGQPEVVDDSDNRYITFDRNNGTGNLSVLPCRKRKLDEIHTTVGLLSNIQVRVIYFHSQSVVAKATTTSAIVKNSSESINNESGKRKRQQSIPIVSFANVTDESGIVMSLIDPTGNLLSVLCTAKKENDKIHLILTNVLTKFQSSLRGIKYSSPVDEIILVPTNETTGFLISSDSKGNNYTHRNVDVSVNVETQMLSTGDSAYRIGNPVGDERTGKHIEVISHLVDVIVNQVSVRENEQLIFSHCSSYLNFILRKDSDEKRNYSTAVQIHMDEGIIDENSILQTPILSASSVILKALCGGVDSFELMKDPEVCEKSMNFLRALLNDSNVKLKWVVEMGRPGDDSPRIAKTVLYNL